jgi:hypothetical protein
MVWWMAAGRILLLEDPDKGRGIPIQVWLAIAVGIGLVIFMKKTQRRRAQSTIQSTIARASAGGVEEARGPGTLKGQHDPEVARLYVELNEFAREMEGRMDTKITYLRRLIADAEKVMGELNQAIAAGEAVRKGEPRPVAPATSNPPADKVPEKPTPPKQVDIILGDVPDRGPNGPGQDVQDIGSRILGLAAEGKPKEAIAEAVGVPKGEVELVLSLHRASQKQKKRLEPREK